MSETPKWIWAKFPEYSPIVAAPSHIHEATRYVRADLHAALEAQLAERVKEAANIAFDEMFAVTGAPVARAVQQKILALSALEATPPAPKVTDLEAALVVIQEKYDLRRSTLLSALTAAQEAGKP